MTKLMYNQLLLIQLTLTKTKNITMEILICLALKQIHNKLKQLEVPKL